jgi:peptidoglycan/LPS O-acetylase OafA/YrhL
MLLSGWSYEPDTGVGSPLSLAGLLAWLVPFSPPPGSAFGYEWIVPLWYVSTYLWFLLLSPALLCAFRLWGWRLLLMPLVGVVLYGSGTIRVQGGTDEVLFSLCTYGACWMLGFGHHDRRLRALSRGRTVVIGVALMAAGLAYAVTHRTAETGLHLSDIPVADALYGLGFTLILLRLSPSVPWRLGGWIGALVAAVNRRAMTIYLWGSACIWTAREIPHLVPMPDGWKDMAVLGVARGYLLTWVLVAGVVLVLGWVEDVAASRRPRISPLAPPTSRAPTRS